MSSITAREKERNSAAPRQDGYSIVRIRTAVCILTATAVLVPKLYQPGLNTLWSFLFRSSVFRWSTFETLWTVFCYSVAEVTITNAFMQHPEWRLAPTPNRSKPKGMRRPSRRVWEGVTYVAPLLVLDLTMVKKFAGVRLEDMLLSGNYAPTVPGHRQTFLVPSLHNFASDSPLQTQRALPLESPSSRRLVLELFGSLVLYDALFFAFHLAMHILPGIRSWHRPHHSHGEMHPQITNQLHIFERLGLVLLANFSLNILGSHVLTRTLFVPVFVWLLVELHSGMDLPWGYDKVLPTGWGGGARKHAQHHRDGGGGLEPYFNWCDGVYDRVRRYLDSSAS